MTSIVFTTKIKKGTSGRYIIKLPKKITTAHFVGEHAASNTDIFENILTRDLHRALNGRTMLYLDDLPTNVSVVEGFLSTVTVTL